MELGHSHLWCQHCKCLPGDPAASQLTLSGTMLSDEWVFPAPGHRAFNLEAALLGIGVRSAPLEVETTSYEDGKGPSGLF